RSHSSKHCWRCIPCHRWQCALFRRATCLISLRLRLWQAGCFTINPGGCNAKDTFPGVSPAVRTTPVETCVNSYGRNGGPQVESPLLESPLPDLPQHRVKSPISVSKRACLLPCPLSRGRSKRRRDLP